ncbi:MAG: hypothetical protein F6J98_32930 [Moorea sp. SIO4G2]|nr:hypothetical protein [Moorena sp. SIO4G2]
MQKLRNALLALFIAIALTWMPSFTVASAQAQDAPDLHPGLQFAIDGTWEFVQFQSGLIEPGEEFHVFYDSQRLSDTYNPACAPFGPSTKVTFNSIPLIPEAETFDLTELDCLKCGEDCENIVDYVKVGDFEAPECDGSEKIKIWFTGTDDLGICEDDNNYTFEWNCNL